MLTAIAVEALKHRQQAFDSEQTHDICRSLEDRADLHGCHERAETDERSQLLPDGCLLRVTAMALASSVIHSHC